MFFGLFKRSRPPAATPKPRAAAKPPSRRASRSRALADLPPPPGALQVSEGSEQTDWALWEDSVALLDSQLQSLQPAVKIYQPERPTSTDMQDLEPFARVRRKDP